jgi:hypothetical protein
MIKRWECTESDVCNCTYSLLEWGAHAGLFIGRTQQPYYDAFNAPSYLPRQ